MKIISAFQCSLTLEIVAACSQFKCDGFGFTVEAWDDGNPYIEDIEEKRHNFYDPCEEAQTREIVEGILGHIASVEECDVFLRTGGGSEDLILLIPYSQFRDWIPRMGSTLNGDGDLVHRHVVILESDGRHSMRVGEDYVDVTEHKLQEPQQVARGNALPRAPQL